MPRRKETRPVRLEAASTEDAGSLAVVAALAFYDDRKWMPDALREASQSLDDPDKGPAHVSYQWTRKLIESLSDREAKASGTTYYKVILGDELIVGGLLVVARPDFGDGEWRCEGIYVDPDYQDRGIGQEILRQMYRRYPDVVRWSLDTPDVPFRFFDYENVLPQEERLKL
jgi:ribosomal protein S18 acetylase RimI-like enzyme